jgi:hypothetical protein
MSNLSIASPVRSPESVSKSSLPIKVSKPSAVVAMHDAIYPASASLISTKGCKIEHVPPRQTKNICRPWEGPLPASRISPKWCLGDTLQKAKVRPSLSSCTTVFKGAARRY